MSEPRKKPNPIVFAGILSLVCGLLLTAAATGLKPFQLDNMEADRQKNILKAAGIIDGDMEISKKTVKALYSEKIETVTALPDGTLLDATDTRGLPLFLYKENNTVKAYIIPIESRGLWGKIYGYMAFENDGMTVAGFTVYSHSETPGLGGEIEKQWFGKNFIGKKIINDQNRFVSIGIAKGSAENLPPEEQSHYVDGISGATLTGKYLSQGLRRNLEHYEPVSIHFRGGRTQ